MEEPVLLDAGARERLRAARRAYLEVPDEAVFLERALILQDAAQRYAGHPPGVRQGGILRELCERITPVVGPEDVLLGRIHQQIPTPEEEEFVRRHPELFLSPGLPGVLVSTSIYIPDWGKLLREGLPGLVAEVDAHEQAAHDDRGLDELQGVRLSLQAIARLARRYAEAARRLADSGRPRDPAVSPQALRQSAIACAAVAERPPRTFREALQLLSLFRMVLACVAGGRNVTPGRMDQYLWPFYRDDLAAGRLTRTEAVELLAHAMLGFSQLAGNVATDFQSTKRSPCRYSHTYVTLAGTNAEGECAVNDLSFAILDALPLVDYREPSLSIRYFPGIHRGFWERAVEAMRDGRPVFAYNDGAVVPALVRHGVPERAARDYAHCACLICFLPGKGLPPARRNHNLPQYLLQALDDGPATFEDLVGAFCARARAGLEQARRAYAGRAGASPYPLAAWPLFEGHLEAGSDYPRRQPRFADQHALGVATAVDSLLAIRQVVYRERALSLADLASLLRQDFAGGEALRQRLQAAPSYGSDDPEVAEMARVVGELWAEEVARAGEGLEGVRMRPGFHSWLYNLEVGKATGATPDGRLRGEPLSSDHSPEPRRPRALTEALRCTARLPHHRCCSGGTILRVVPHHFQGEEGSRRLGALIEGYFAEGGLQLHFVFADAAVLRDAVAHPERHRDLLVRVTGFSEYFTRLLPQVQAEIIRRAECA